MKIKRIDIVGFKSFVEKVSLDFEEGITAVLGPNGCGKSNIVDAIRWAMGEQNAKNLRGRMMEDVIFGGSENRKPLGMAEVSLIFSNEDGLAPAAYREYAEIMITRRLYRNGESEYLINKTACRLLDITELFMDTGAGARTYSIIEQGKIGMILNAKPEDRRSLIEEAAGVTKYKARKKSALRKIEATRQNLLRLGDIISEVRRQSGSLKRQAQKAERYRRLREEHRDIEIRFARRRFEELRLEKEAAASSERESSRNLEDLTARLQKAELHLEELRLSQAGTEKEVAQGQEKVFHLTGEIQQVEGKIGFGRKEMENLQRQSERLSRELDEMGRSLENADGDEEALRTDEEKLGEELERKSRELAEGEGVLEELTAAERSLNEGLEENRRALMALLGDMSRLGNQHEDARRRLELLEERTSRNRREAVSVNEQMEEARQLFSEVSGALREMEQQRLQLQEERDHIQEKIRSLRGRSEEKEVSLHQLRDELSRFRSRLESLRELERNLEGYGGGVRALLRNSPLRERFSGLIADLLDVPPGLEIAVEAVLGDRLQALVAESPEDIRAALDFLRQKGGRCTFLLPVAGMEAVSAPAGADPLKDLVKTRAEGVDAILEGVFLVEDLEPHFQRPLPPGAVLVTKDGEFLTHRGEVNGGAGEDLKQGLLKKKSEIKNLESKTEEYLRLVAGAEEERSTLREDLQDSEAGLREVHDALHRQELKMADSRKDLQRLQQEEDRLRERLEVLGLEEDQLHEERVGLEDRQSRSEQERKEKEGKKESLEEAVSDVQDALREYALQIGDVREKVTSLKVDVASLREREEGRRRNLERLEKLRRELHGRLALDRSRREEAEREQDRLRKEEERLQTELEILFRKREEEKGRFESVREKFDELGVRVREREGEVKELGARLHREREALAARQLKVREFEMESENLRQNVLSRHRLDISETSGSARDKEDDESFEAAIAERRLGELDRILETMGEVNLTAIEEFQELEERHQFLLHQQEDLRQSLDGLQAAITKINRTTRRRFREAFDQINQKFQEVFPRLFRGGKAELKLTDEEDLLETGIDIIVQPPGKKLQSVNLLSGGEKALTAVALIFSIFLIKPSPFCLLDEVDAPLDDANIGLFNEMVREMAQRSQFILITHNKRTMEVADVLYGVTMEEPGVSKTVSVRINDFGVADAV